jgi:hypothetical protein
VFDLWKENGENRVLGELLAGLLAGLLAALSAGRLSAGLLAGLLAGFFVVNGDGRTFVEDGGVDRAGNDLSFSIVEFPDN